MFYWMFDAETELCSIYGPLQAHGKDFLYMGKIVPSMGKMFAVQFI